LVEWNVDCLAKLLRQIKARRICRGTADGGGFEDPEDTYEGGAAIIHEVKEIITLPRFSKKEAESMPDPESLELGSKLVEQLRDYVATIANLYRVRRPAP